MDHSSSNTRRQRQPDDPWPDHKTSRPPTQTINLPARRISPGSRLEPGGLKDKLRKDHHTCSIGGNSSPFRAIDPAPPETITTQSTSAFWSHILIGAISIGIILSSFGFRDRITAVLPDLASFYDSIGMATTRNGLEIDDIVAERRGTGQSGRVNVSGMVQNSSAQQMVIPDLQVALGGEQDAPLKKIGVALPRSNLAAGEGFAFSFDVQPVSKDDTRVLVSFSPIAE